MLIVLIPFDYAYSLSYMNETGEGVYHGMCKITYVL